MYLEMKELLLQDLRAEKITIDQYEIALERVKRNFPECN